MPAQTHQTPRFVEVTHTCDCGRTYAARIYHAVNVTLEPALLYQLISGRLNIATCPNCGRKAASPLPFIYHDMKRGLFAYVHPNADLGDEDRDRVLEHLRQVYSEAVQYSEQMTVRPTGSQMPRNAEREESDALHAARGMIDPATPPMQVIFGLDGLISLVDSLLEPDERLGHLALHSTSQHADERAHFLQVAEQLARESGCQVDTQERDDSLTVEIYGPRIRIGRLVNVLHGSA